MRSPNWRLITTVSPVLLTAVAAFAQIADPPATGFDHARIVTIRGFMRTTASFPSSITNAYTSLGSEDLRNTPSWSPDDETPPLSPRDAVLIAQSTADKWYSGHDEVSWLLKQIALLPLESENGKWFWQATLEVTKAGRKRDVDVVIRMDGTVLTRVNAPRAE